ncbi:DUF6468 domain-containing protein [Roseicella aquatilis]|uniref:DUF6468 domain-containing protein n=1 Tax=Roseicella aquatilis TaxID=2527868 RepID=A0A4R4D4R5_9PROT|nr:DUF6468 domain-containing protein [Roseicella aquatilis]TCZ53668.1 hypothetical protein EXY23_24385 [Roseicella aquatilis]
MTTLEWALQALLVLALCATVPGAIRLERALTTLARDRTDLAAAAKQLAEAVGEAEAAMLRLRGAADRAGRTTSEQVTAANRVAEDLRFLLDRAEAQADRLDLAVRSNRAPREAAAAPPPSAPRPQPSPESAPNPERLQAEESLLRVFRSRQA